jgi:hypothetical protein
MAMANGYTTLMIRKETKEILYEAKQIIEKEVGIPMTNSQFVEYMCRRIVGLPTSIETK